MGFWAQLKESLLEMLVGSHQLDAWRAHEKQHEEARRVCQRHYEEFLKSR